jgi:hypothetical protein
MSITRRAVVLILVVEGFELLSWVLVVKRYLFKLELR